MTVVIGDSGSDSVLAVLGAKPPSHFATVPKECVSLSSTKAALCALVPAR
ncbi:MAG: hypothetical protein IK000_08745 [Bacteroidaceae bacterium]|nr:hypothetical protein [Bacteroidaceae bacterium]